MPDTPIEEDRKVGRPTTEIDHDDPQISLFLAEDGLTGSQGLQHHIHDIKPRAIHTLDDVLR